MNDVAAQTVELRLLTHRPAEMTEWWAALLGGAPQSLNAWMTAIHGDSLQVVIERSGIALDYHPEASGVTAINLALRDVQAARPALNRLSKLGSQPHLATGQPGVTGALGPRSQWHRRRPAPARGDRPPRHRSRCVAR